MPNDAFRLLLAMLERAPDAALVCGLDGTVHFLNSEATRLTGCSAQEAAKRSLLRDILFLSHSGGEPVEASALLQDAARAIYTLRTREGKAHRVEAYASRLPAEAQAVVLSIRDLGAAGDYQITDHFLSVLSHALRSPLNAMTGWLYVLKGGANVPEAMARKALDGIGRAVEQQQRLVEDMRDMAHILMGTLKVELHAIDVRASIESAVNEIRQQAASRGVRLRVQHGATLRAVADAGRLQQAIRYLLANAVKYTPAGGEVTVASEETGRFLEIRVSDNGEPIPPAVLPFIFDRFGQGNSTVTRADDGFGLALVKKLIELQGGQVTARGQPAGAYFIMRLAAAERSSIAGPRRSGSDGGPVVA